MDYKNLYKQKPTRLNDIYLKFSKDLKTERDKKRKELFWGARLEIAESISTKTQATEKKNRRLEMLKNWKEEKMKRLEEEKKSKKPVFKVGVVQRKVTGSPIFSQSRTQSKKTFTHSSLAKTEEKNSGVLTRAQVKNMTVKPKLLEMKPAQKNSFKKCYKYEDGKKKPIDSHVFRVPESVLKLPKPCEGLTVPYSPFKITKNESTQESKTEEPIKPPEKEEVVDSKNITPPQTESTNTETFTPIHYSPFVTVRSRNRSSRKLRKSLSIDVDEHIKKEENVIKCRIFSFRKYIECETKRLLELCTKWKQIYVDVDEVPSDVEGDIDAVIGKTNLLTSDKFMQFKGLIDKCENGDPFVKVDDLQGFQDWVAIEVEKIDAEFHKLDIKKSNNWESESKPVQKAAKEPKVKAVPKKPVGKSNIRAHILAARKLLKENGVSDEQPADLGLSIKPVTPMKKQSLLQEVLTSETKKSLKSSSKKSPRFKENRNSGLEIMIASQKNKFPTPLKLNKSPALSDFEIFVEDIETPSKSILKKSSTINTPKGQVTFKDTKGSDKRKKGADDKYVRTVGTDDEMSPERSILGNLANLNISSGGRRTRSKSRQPSFTMSPQLISHDSNPKGCVTFEDTKSSEKRTKGPEGKYFRPDDVMSPEWSIIGKLGNLVNTSSGGRRTRSQSRQMSVL